VSRRDDQLAATSAGSATTPSTSCSSSSPSPASPPWSIALARPVLPAGLVLRFEPTRDVDGWRVVACAPRRQLGTLTRHQDPSGRVAWRAWTRAGDPVQITGVCWWRRRLDAGTALAWVTPVSGARCLALAAYVRALTDGQLQELLVGLPRDHYDRLLEAAFAPRGTAA
jgi:hypothetical protein